MAVTQELIDNIKKQLEGLSPEEQQVKLQQILAELPPEDRAALTGQGGNNQQQCPFCLMSEGKIPVKTIYEDDSVLAILDINPASKGHTLLFPKEHHLSITELDDKLTAHIFKVANHLANILKKALGAGGMTILVQDGALAGQKAPHTLINLIPRFENDGVLTKWSPKPAADNDLEDLQKKLTALTKDIKIKKEEAIIVQKTVTEKEATDEDIRNLTRIP